MKASVLNSLLGRFFLGTMAMAALLLASGCGGSQSNERAIRIENEVVSPNGGEKDKQVVDAFLQEKDEAVKKLSKQMSGYFSGPMTIDEAHASNEKGLSVPALIYNGKPLNNDHTIPQKLSAETTGAAVATIFVKAGEEFVRISTSLKRTDMAVSEKKDESAAGSTLSHTHPAYSACLAGRPYSGTATLFGKIFMTEYVPILDKQGKVIGIQFVGLDISSDVFMLKRKLSVS